MTQRPMKSSIIPETVWAVAEEHIVQQYTMCLLCGPSHVPEKVFFIQGTSYCSTHAREAYTQCQQQPVQSQTPLPPTA